MRLLAIALILFSFTAQAATKITLSTKGETMFYDKDTFTVKAGEKVELTFVNKSKGLTHNVVILKKGSDTMKAGLDGIKAGEAKLYVPQGGVALFSSKLVKPLGKEVMKFTAPKEPGEYPFVCTFPGHFATMKGKMIVK